MLVKSLQLTLKGATVELADGVEGYLRASEASRDRVEDATLVLSVGDEVEAKFTGVDRKNRVVSLVCTCERRSGRKRRYRYREQAGRRELLQQRYG